MIVHSSTVELLNLRIYFFMKLVKNRGAVTYVGTFFEQLHLNTWLHKKCHMGSKICMKAVIAQVKKKRGEIKK